MVLNNEQKRIGGNTFAKTWSANSWKIPPDQRIYFCRIPSASRDRVGCRSIIYVCQTVVDQQRTNRLQLKNCQALGKQQLFPEHVGEQPLRPMQPPRRQLAIYSSPTNVIPEHALQSFRAPLLQQHSTTTAD